jgi:endogenous inhibitor of DNA gyrase (YacG/DUF329 family)
MAVVMITCPNTGRPVSTGIESDPRSFACLPDVLSHSKCPHCGSEHVWWTREAWLAADGGVDAPTLIVRQRSIKKAG